MAVSAFFRLRNLEYRFPVTNLIAHFTELERTQICTMAAGTPAELMVAAQELVKKMPLAFMLVLALASFGLILVLSQLTTTPSGKGAHFGGWSSCAASWYPSPFVALLSGAPH
jgi:hypothetical protein